MMEKSNIIAEDYVITLSNEGRYYLVNELSDLIEDGTRYFSAVGVNPDNTFDFDDTIYLNNYERDGKQLFKKVDENDEKYRALALYAATINAIDAIPGYAKKMEEVLKQSS